MSVKMMVLCYATQHGIVEITNISEERGSSILRVHSYTSKDGGIGFLRNIATCQPDYTEDRNLNIDPVVAVATVNRA
jgi:hypothetical protein